MRKVYKILILIHCTLLILLSQKKTEASCKYTSECADDEKCINEFTGRERAGSERNDPGNEYCINRCKHTNECTDNKRCINPDTEETRPEEKYCLKVGDGRDEGLCMHTVECRKGQKCINPQTGKERAGYRGDGPGNEFCIKIDDSED